MKPLDITGTKTSEFAVGEKLSCGSVIQKDKTIDDEQEVGLGAKDDPKQKFEV